MPNVDWTQPFAASYRYMRVSRETGEEVERVAGIRNGGSIDRNRDKQTFESGSVPAVGAFGIGRDWLRVYLDAEFRDGTTASEALGTFMPYIDKTGLRGTRRKGDVELQGLLMVLDDDQFDTVYTVQAGSNAVEKAAAIARSCGLEVLADDSDYTLSTDWVYGFDSDSGGDSKLDVVNDLLGAAGFSSARTDPMGRVLMRRYVEPADVPASFDVKEGPSARFLPDVTAEDNSGDVPNVIHADYSTQEASVRGTWVDDDPESAYSTVSTGRRVVKRYSYSDLPDGVDQDGMQQAANEKAAELGRNDRSVTRRLKVKHVYNGAAVGDACNASYCGVSGKYAVRTQSIELGAGCLVTAELVRYERV